MNGPASKTTFGPDELGMLKDIFIEITSQAWFVQTAEAKESFARYLFASFPTDALDPQAHRAACEAAARALFSRGREANKASETPPRTP